MLSVGIVTLFGPIQSDSGHFPPTCPLSFWNWTVSDGCEGLLGAFLAKKVATKDIEFYIIIDLTSAINEKDISDITGLVNKAFKSKIVWNALFNCVR